MKDLKLFFGFLNLVTLCMAANSSAEPQKPAYSKEQAIKILKEAEAIRSLDKAKITVDLTTEANKLTTIYDLDILRSTARRAFIDFLAPKEEVGRRMLAKGRNYWSTFPDSKHVVAISRREMIGNSAFALADIFQLDADEDYDPMIVAEEKEGDTTLLKLNLKAKHSEAPYHRIEYWVEKIGYFPTKAKFYGLSNKHLKTMTIEERKLIAGRIRPQVSKMVDEVIKGRTSWWKTKSMKAASIPDKVFQKSYLNK